MTVDVVNNQVDRALKSLKRKLVEEGLTKQWKANEVRRGERAAAGREWGAGAGGVRWGGRGPRVPKPRRRVAPLALRLWGGQVVACSR